MKKLIIFVIGLIIMPNIVLANTKEKVQFDKCVDGDTAKFIYKDKEEKFRFLAIDTPESTNKIEVYGKEASTYTCEKLTNAKSIKIEFDSNSDKTDKYGRYLVWVYVDDKLLQDEIVKAGYAEVAYLYGNYAYTDQLKESQEYAKTNKLNIWSNYEKEKNPIWIYILILILIIIMCILSKSFRNKIINKSKNTLEKKLKKSLKL